MSHAFLVQNEFYSTQTLRTSAQDNARAATELIAREIRNTAEDGVVVAGMRTLTIRSPIAVAVVCNKASASEGDVLTEGGQAALDTDEVAGLALRGAATWEFANTTWSALNGSDGSSATSCEANGADTVAARNEFHRLVGLSTLFGSTAVEGDVVMLFRETTFKIQTSELDSTTFGLFRGAYGDSLVEFATGIDTTAQFQYRVAGGGYSDTISAVSLPNVDAVRIVADTRKPAPTGGRADITFGWSVNVPLRTVR